MNRLDETVATNGHPDSALTRNSIHENGYRSPNDRVRDVANSRDVRVCQYEHDTRQERTKHVITQAAEDSPPKGSGGRAVSDARHCETWRTKDSGLEGAKDCNNTEHSSSEVTRIVPLKPQRSKKSLNKENKGAANPETTSRPDVSEAEQMAKSRDERRETGRRAEGDATLIATDTENISNKHRGEAATSHQQQSQLQRDRQQEIRDSGEAAGQWTRGDGPHEDHFQTPREFKDNLPSSSKFPTAPPRTLPLKKQWSRDRQSYVDSSHIHYRTPSQDTTRRKQAVNQPALRDVCPSSESKSICMSLKRFHAKNLVITI